LMSKERQGLRVYPQHAHLWRMKMKYSMLSMFIRCEL
jgi:hypothetical protein